MAELPVDLATLVGLGEAAEKVEWVAGFQVGPGRIVAEAAHTAAVAVHTAVKTLAERGELA